MEQHPNLVNANVAERFLIGWGTPTQAYTGLLAMVVSVPAPPQGLPLLTCLSRRTCTNKPPSFHDSPPLTALPLLP